MLQQKNGNDPTFSQTTDYVPDVLPYPSNPLVQRVARLPLLLWRMGLGRLAGRLFLVLGTTGRKSGQPRYTALEYHAWRGRKYVFSAWGDRAQWYKNIEADPHATIQTWEGPEAVTVRRVTDDGELAEAFELVEQNAAMRRWVALLGIDLNRDAFLAHKNRYHLLTFDPTETPAPPPLETDLWWVGPVALGALLAGWLRRKRGS